jgi:hypothetical protein
VLHDPIGGAQEMAGQAAALKTVGRETVNGIAARIVEAPVTEGKGGKYKLWLEEKFGFPVKQAVTLGGAPERVVFEMRQLSYAPSAPGLFAEPAGCQRIAGSSNATGGHAETTVSASGQGAAEIGASRPADPAAKTLIGKWDFTAKDGKGVQWTGALQIARQDGGGIECDLNMSSANSGKGMGGGCDYDSKTRTLTFTGGSDSSKFSFTAVLSPDGKSLTQGRWDAAGSWSAVRASAANR